MSNKNPYKKPGTEPKGTDMDNSLDAVDQLVSELQHEADDIEDLVEAAEEVAADEHSSSLSPLQIAEQKAQEHHDNLLRLAAEMENLRKRTTREVEQARKFAVERFAKEVLLVKDSLEMGKDESLKDTTTVETIREGLELTMKQLDSALEKFSIKLIDAEGVPFNPEFHEAMAMQPSADLEPNTVMAVMQKGYMINDRVLRPARVLVSRAIDE